MKFETKFESIEGNILFTLSDLDRDYILNSKLFLWMCSGQKLSTEHILFPLKILDQDLSSETSVPVDMFGSRLVIRNIHRFRWS